MTAEQIEQSVRVMYKGGGYVVLSQVRNGTGFVKAPRTADMLAINTWPSRGVFAEGFEIKTYKGDLLRELAKPLKAEEIAQYCRKWWLAVPVGLVDGALIPDGWGVISVDDKLKAGITKQAREHEAKPMDALFVCSVLRAFEAQYVPLADVEPRIKEEQAKAREEAVRSVPRRIKELEEAVENFRDASGVDLMDKHGHPRWDIRNIGEAVNLMCNLKGKPVEELRAARKALEAGADAVDIALAAFTEVRT